MNDSLAAATGRAVAGGGRDLLVFAVPVAARRGVAAAGAVCMPWQRRGDFQRLWRELRARGGGPRRLRWRKVPRHPDFFEALVEAFFARPWLRFRAVVDTEAGRDDGGERALRALLAHAERLDGRTARHRLRVAAPTGGAPAGARVVAEDAAPALQVARLLTVALRAAHAGRLRGRRRRALAGRIARHAGVAELVAALAPADARLQVWPLVELRGTTAS